MSSRRSLRGVRMLVVSVAVLFGLVTLFAGGRVLLDSDPGYIVFRPLLVYNTAMGVAYVTAGIFIQRSPVLGSYAAGAVLTLNFLVLIGIVLVSTSGGAVAIDSLRAMTVRTVVWLVLFLAAFCLARSRTGVRASG